MESLRSVVRGCGHYLPSRIVTNDELATTLDTSDEWISTRSGIRARHIAADGERTADLAVAAAQAALTHAQLEASDIDLLVLATTTPDRTFPATATTVQRELGMNGGFAFDIQAVCSGFLYALGTVDGYLRTGMARRALIIGAETFSRILDWSDRSTAVLFGDGAGAIVVEAQPANGPDARGIVAVQLRSDGQHEELLYVDGGVATGDVGHVRMHGQEVFRHAVRNLAEIARQVLDQAHVGIDDVDWLVPHQANLRIIAKTAETLGLPPERLVTTISNHGNTSAASIPLALSVAVADGRIQPGQLILTEAIGGGLTWGAALLRW